MTSEQMLKLSDKLNKILSKVTDEKCKPLNNAKLSIKDINVLKEISFDLYSGSEDI